MEKSYTSRMPDRAVREYFPTDFDKDVGGFVTEAKPFNASYGPRKILVKSCFGTARVEIRENDSTGTVSYDLNGNALAVGRARSRLSRLLGVDLKEGVAESKSNPRPS